MTDTSIREWWSAADLAEAGLPDLPSSKRKINEMAAREGWKAQPGKCRRRRGVGGGFEFHWTLLPVRARLALTEVKADAPEPKMGRNEAWQMFESATAKAQASARVRLTHVRAVLEIERAGLTRSAASDAVAIRYKVSTKTLWNCFQRIEGIEEADWLAYLVDRRGTSKRKAVNTPLNEAFCEQVKSDFLRLSCPSFTSCYDRAVRVAEAEGSAVPPIQQVRRWYKRTVSKPTEVYCRKGAQSLRQFFPHQTRSKTSLHPMQCIQGDYHKFDVFIRVPDVSEPVRIQGVFFSDVYSGKILGWRLDTTANSHTVQLCLGDVIEHYGVPMEVVLDNGREFAAKAITGGAPNRFRFKITEEDIPGLLPMLGVGIHWTEPYSGQSKPIERAFRDLCDRVSKHPAFEGAYTGNSPDAKPENYGDRAIPLEDFRAVLEEEILLHNARTGRRSEIAFGKSFDQVFNEGYKTAPIRRATAEQRRLWLLRAEGLRGDSKNGELRLHGSRFWGEWMYRIAGQKIAARFDADNLMAGLHVYDLKGGYLGHAPCLAPGQFLSAEDARTHNRARRDYTKAVRSLAEAERKVSDSEIAARLRAAGKPVEPELPKAEIVQMVPAHPNAPKPARPSTDSLEAQDRVQAQITRLAERLAPEPEEAPETRFARACELEALLADDQPITPAQSDWLADYQSSAEYRGYRRMRQALDQRS